jgi:hypothetical protein
MPSKSPAQHRLMLAVANNPEFAKKVKIPQKVGKDFAAADKGGAKTAMSYFGSKPPATKAKRKTSSKATARSKPAAKGAPAPTQDPMLQRLQQAAVVTKNLARSG